MTTPKELPAVRHAGWIIATIVGAQFMLVLDTNIVNVSLPSMGEYFNQNQTVTTWVVNSYTLTFGGFLLLGGRLGDILGRKRSLAIGLVLFALGSALSGLAISFPILIAGRVLQGLGGALAAPAALALVSTTFPLGPLRTRAFVAYSAVSGAGAAMGVLLGGVLTQFASWRWVLMVNVPVGIVLLVGVFVLLNETERHPGRLDIASAVLSVPGVLGIVSGFINAAENGWGHPLTIAALALGVAMLVAFFIRQARTDEPILPLRVIKDRTRGVAYLVMLIAGAAMFAQAYFIVYFVQRVLGYDSLQSGLAYLPVSIIIVSVSQMMTKLMPRFGPRPLVIIGTVLLAAGMLFFGLTLNPQSTYLTGILPGLALIALSVGFIFVPVSLAGVAGVRPTDSGIASATINVGQQIGGSIGLAVLATIAAAGAATATANGASLAEIHSQSATTAFLAATVFAVAALGVAISMPRTQQTRAARPDHKKERKENTMSDITLPKAVENFVMTTNSHDGDALFAVFAPEATVVDDGTTYATPAELREWIKVHQVDPKIVITPTSFDTDRLVASVNGEFPGGPLVFAFTFTTQDEIVTSLSIALS